MTLLWGGAALCALAYWRLVLAAPSWPRSVLKAGAVALLAVIAGLSGMPLLALALTACALGDWCLSRNGDTAFMSGVGAFALGHLLYVWLFLTQPGSDLSQLGQGLYAPALGVLGLAMALLLLPRAGALRWPVASYIPIILSMGLAALSLPSGFMLVVLAAGLFILSDCILAVERFVVSPDQALHRVLGAAVWPLYWTAQAVFLFAFTGVPTL